MDYVIASKHPQAFKPYWDHDLPNSPYNNISTIMDEADRLKYETQSKDLRLELKTWELDFAKSHNGSKPSRDDIKGNPKIASMYKNYNKLRDILSGRIPPPPPPQTTSKKEDVDDDEKNRKRKPHNAPSHTPSSKRFRPAETPSRTPHATTAVTPSLSRQLFSPTVPTSIGPTPQRDGRVLGLFDFLPFKDAEVESPSKPNGSIRPTEGGAAAATAAAGHITAARRQQQRGNGRAVQETPRKGKYTMDTGLGIEVDLARTPSTRSRPQQSPRKGVLATPSQRHNGGNRVVKTPSSSHSVSKLQFSTPAFLRRIPMPNISENSEFASPEPIRLPRKPMVRGLSSILADLRRTEEEQLDDDLDVLREMENEGTSTKPAGRSSTSNTKPAPTPAPTSKKAGNAQDMDSILAEDSQKQNMNLLGGFDDEGMHDSEDGQQEGVDRGGKPLKVYKKKGQKRTTRKANMRPVRTKRPSAGAVPGSEQAGESDNEVVPETQLGARGQAQEEEDDPALLSGSEFAGSDYDDDEDELAQDQPTKLKRTAGKPGKRETAPAAKVKGDDKPEGTVKKAARKVNELAHANFKRLKLRNSGAKGGPGFNSRFRRRR
ncbi:DNA replication regulator SLD2 [Cytospora mali]|uniref:DNA replication regulator SLD2 n=1 Tax=Cytospora mali TaxID=578113 RepID=A0A194W6X8_CYTMA|nr:DNA replication regulator SLD2 [Valsa mali]